MIRMQQCGNFSHVSSVTSFSLDGVTRRAPISCLFERSVLLNRLGAWDCVRFGADSEMLSRASKVLGHKFGVIDQVSMICQDLDTSLTNHSSYGIDKVKGMSTVRSSYKKSWSRWHETIDNADDFYVPFPSQKRAFDAPEEMIVPFSDIKSNLHDVHL